MPKSEGNPKVFQSNEKPSAKRPNVELVRENSDKKSTGDLYSQEANPKPLEADPDNL